MSANDNAAPKTCRSCGETRAADDFYSGRATCKECVRASVRRHRRASESVRVYDRSRGSRAPLVATQKYRADYPDAYRAHTAVGNAVRDGRLAKEPCLFCGDTKVHGHHRDYSRPLDVIWLCAKCHHRLHANFPETAAHEPKHRRKVA